MTLIIWQHESWQLVRTEYGYFDLKRDGIFVTRFDNHRQFLDFVGLMADAAHESERPWWAK